MCLDVALSIVKTAMKLGVSDLCRSLWNTIINMNHLSYELADRVLFRIVVIYCMAHLQDTGSCLGKRSFPNEQGFLAREIALNERSIIWDILNYISRSDVRERFSPLLNDNGFGPGIQAAIYFSCEIIRISTVNKFLPDLPYGDQIQGIACVR